jgi:hypothetical protein
MDGQELESSLTESAPRIFRSLKVRAEKVRRFPFWECAHESARFPNSRNTDARAEHTQAPISFLGMREIKILEHKKCGVQFNSPFDRSFWKSAHGKSAPLSFWECALSNSWNAMRGKPAHNQIRGTQKRAQVCILFSELCFRPVLSTQNTNYNANATNTATAAPVITASARE